MLRGILGAGLVVFQDYSFVRHFMSTCSRVLGVDHGLLSLETGGDEAVGNANGGRTVNFTILPMGLDVERSRRVLLSEKTRQHRQNLLRIHGHKLLLVGIDKSEQVKGIRHKLLGFSRFLASAKEVRTPSITKLP